MDSDRELNNARWLRTDWGTPPGMDSTGAPYWDKLAANPEGWDGTPPRWNEATPPGLVQDYVKIGLAATDAIPEFHEWSFLCVLSAYVGRFWSVDLGPADIYPNLYTVLVGPSSKARKSTCIRMAEKLAKALGISRIPEETTPEAFYDTFSEKPTAFMIAPEFSGILAIAAKKYGAGIVEFLMNVYDCPDELERRTKGEGIIRLTEPYLTILGGATMTMLRERLTTAASLGGFTPRFAMIFSYKRSLSKVVPRGIPATAYASLAKQIVERVPCGDVGQMTTTDEARQAMGVVGTAMTAYLEERVGNLGGAIAARALPRVLKIATLSALAQSRTEITFADLNYGFGLEARRFIDIERLREVLATSMNPQEVLIRISGLIEDRGSATRTELARWTHPNVSVKKMDAAIASLIEQEKIIMSQESSGGRPRHRYVWVDDGEGMP